MASEAFARELEMNEDLYQDDNLSGGGDANNGNNMIRVGGLGKN